MAANKHTVLFYGLSTCIHCKHTREFLEDNNVDFTCIYVDLLEGQEREDALNKVREYNPRISFPTLVIDDGKQVIVGFNPDKIKEALEL